MKYLAIMCACAYIANRKKKSLSYKCGFCGFSNFDVFLWSCALSAHKLNKHKHKEIYTFKLTVLKVSAYIES